MRHWLASSAVFPARRGVNYLLTLYGESVACAGWGSPAGGTGNMKHGFIEIVAATTDGIQFEAHGRNADLLVATCLAAAAQGDIGAYYDLGVAYSTGSHGVGCDLIEAHKWFNLAAVSGHEESQWCRADIAEEMTAREIAEAQRRARQWIAASTRRAA